MNQKSLLTPVLGPLLTLSLLCVPFAAQAQSSTAKKELAARVVRLQQPGIEAMARNLAEQPAVEMMERAAQALPSRVAPEKREAVATDIKADVKKYVDEAVPLVRERAIKLAPTTIGAVLEEKLTEDELRQVVTIIESPAYIKFQQLGEEMQRTLVEKLLADTRPTIEPKVQALERSIAARLGLSADAAAKAAKPAPAAKPAAKPASK